MLGDIAGAYILYNVAKKHIKKKKRIRKVKR